MLLILAITAGVGYCLQTIFISSVGEQLALRLRILSYESIIRQPISWFDHEKNSPDFLYSRLASDIPFIKNAVGPRLANAISAFITMVTGFIIATIYGWQVALITMLTVPMILLGLFVQRRIQHKAYKSVSSIRKNIIKWTTRSIKNIWAIQSSSKALQICQRMETIIFPALVEGQKQALSYGLGYAFSECMTFFTFGAAFRFGAVLIRQRLLPIPDLFTIFFVITFGSLSLGQAKSFAPDYFKARLSASFIFKLIEMKSSIDPMNTSGLKPIIEGQIELRNVVLSYPILPNVKILQGTSLIITKGSTIGIVGPVGGGKSSILSILERFYEIDSGEVLIDGVNIKDINLRHLRENIGYVAQEPNLFDLSIRDNILYGYCGPVNAEADLTSLVEKAAMAADADFITEELPQHFETKCGEQGKNLNAGQRQEVALARAVIKEPPIMLLDDPTSCLDAEEEKHVQHAMVKAMPGRTCIIVSNSYSSIKYCDYIAVLVKGKIAEFGKQKELLKSKGIYYNFVREQGVKLLDYTDTSSPNVPPAPSLSPALSVKLSDSEENSDSDSE